MNNPHLSLQKLMLITLIVITVKTTVFNPYLRVVGIEYTTKVKDWSLMETTGGTL